MTSDERPVCSGLKRLTLLLVLTTLCLVASRASAQEAPTAQQEQRSWVIAPHPDYPRLFRDPSGEPLLLVGNYSWGVLSHVGYDYETMLDTLQSSGLNFARVWLFWGDELRPGESTTTGQPLLNIVPYLRTGPGTANDGRPKFDLTRFHPAYFERLHALCEAAQKRGVYLQLCLFDGWLLRTPRWKNHAFQRDNNVNGIDGDPNNSGRGRDNAQGYCSLGNPQAMKLQEAYVRKVVDSVNEFDHIFFEIANENINREWELAMCEYLHEYEKSKPKQHQVMPRDIPNHGSVTQKWNPHVLHAGLTKDHSYRKPLIFDTDWVISSDDDQIRRAMWAGILSGAHFDYLDESFQLGSSHNGDVRGRHRAALRRQIGILAAFTRQIRYWEMAPSDDIVTKGEAITFSSANELAAYLPAGGSATLDLQHLKSAREAHWYNPRTGVWTEAKFDATRPQHAFAAPDKNDWLLYLRNHTDEKPPGSRPWNSRWGRLTRIEVRSTRVC